MREQGAAGLVRHCGCEVKVYQFRKCISCCACSMLTLLLLHILMKPECTNYKMATGNVNTAISLLPSAAIITMGA